jgi:hypothetical protein
MKTTDIGPEKEEAHSPMRLGPGVRLRLSSTCT